MTVDDYPYNLEETPYKLVRNWLQKFQKPLDVGPTEELISLSWSCINEEVDEVYDEIYDTTLRNPRLPFDKEKLTKELCDLLWVTYQMAAFFGLPIEEAFKRVYESNMSKLQSDGTPLLREDGKILKSDNYKPADLGDLFD